MTEKNTQAGQGDQDVRILGLWGEAHEGAVAGATGRVELARALGRVVDTTGVAAPSDAEVAAIALQLLAEEPGFAGPIEAVRSGRQPEAMGVGVVEGTFLMGGLLPAVRRDDLRRQAACAGKLRKIILGEKKKRYRN